MLQGAPGTPCSIEISSKSITGLCNLVSYYREPLPSCWQHSSRHPGLHRLTKFLVASTYHARQKYTRKKSTMKPTLWYCAEEKAREGRCGETTFTLRRLTNIQTSRGAAMTRTQGRATLRLEMRSGAGGREVPAPVGVGVGACGAPSGRPGCTTCRLGPNSSAADTWTHRHGLTQSRTSRHAHREERACTCRHKQTPHTCVVAVHNPSPSDSSPPQPPPQSTHQLRGVLVSGMSRARTFRP